MDTPHALGINTQNQKLKHMNQTDEENTEVPNECASILKVALLLELPI